MAYAKVSSYPGASKTTVTINDVSYDLYEFGSNGTVTFSQAGDVDYLIVGGGASGASGRYYSGGGGGGGDVQQGTIHTTATTYGITVGAGGPAPARHDTQPTASHNGQDSVAFGITAYGGGHAGNLNTTIANIMGNGGGAGGMVNYTGGQSLGGGCHGGNTTSSVNNSAGGAGDSQRGFESSSNAAGAGGLGTASSITGISLIYGSGGSGGDRYASTPVAAPSGGGTGGSGSFDGGSGADGRGGGGGGAGSGRFGGKGGNGTVIIRVATPTIPTEPLPNKLDFTRALRIKTIHGEWLQAKGVGWTWARASDGWIYPVPMNSGSGFFAGTVTVEPDGSYKVTAGTGSGSSNARCAIIAPAPGTKIELESHMDRAGSSVRLLARQITSHDQTTGTAIYDVSGAVDAQLHRSDIITIGTGINFISLIGTHAAGGFFKVLPTTRYRIIQ